MKSTWTRLLMATKIRKINLSRAIWNWSKVKYHLFLSQNKQTTNHLNPENPIQNHPSFICLQLINPHVQIITTPNPPQRTTIKFIQNHRTNQIRASKPKLTTETTNSPRIMYYLWLTPIERINRQMQIWSRDVLHSYCIDCIPPPSYRLANASDNVLRYLDIIMCVEAVSCLVIADKIFS